MVTRHGKPNCHGTPVLNLINVMVILKGPVRDLSPSTRAHDSRKELNIIVTRNDELRIMLELHTLYT